MPTLFKNGKNYSGTSVSLTQAEYDALSETQKNDGTVYFITDSDAVLDASDIALGSGTVEDLAGSIATIETSPATANHSEGEYIVYNGQLYMVTAAITAGQSLTVGTNISATSVGSEVTALNDSFANLFGVGNGSVYQSRIEQATLRYYTYSFPTRANKQIVIVTCVFKTSQAISADGAIAMGFPPAVGLSKVILSGMNTSDNSNLNFYLNSNGSLISISAIASGTWCECNGVYIGNIT